MLFGGTAIGEESKEKRKHLKVTYINESIIIILKDYLNNSTFQKKGESMIHVFKKDTEFVQHKSSEKNVRISTKLVFHIHFRKP